MSDQDAGEYDLADVPEEPRKAKPPVVPEKPLPRLWKTEPDEDERRRKESNAKKEEPTPEVKKPVRPPRFESGRGRGRRRKARAPGGDGSEKKVLVEETPRSTPMRPASAPA